MKPGKSSPKTARDPRRTSLRAQAEAALRKSAADIGAMTQQEVKRLVYELQVHQIELQMQNEELRVAQAELAHTRDQYQELYEFAPAGYLSVDQDARILRANLTLAKLLGQPREALIGKQFSRFVTSGSQDDFHRHRMAMTEGTDGHSCDLTLRRGDGSTFLARVDTMEVDSTRSAGRTFRCFVTDVTEHRLAEQHYQLAFESNPCPMWIYDEGTLRFLAVNAAAVKHYGWTREEFLKMTVKDVRPPEKVRGLLQALKRKRQPSAAFVGEWTHWKKDGTRILVEVTVSSIRFRGQAAMLAIIADVTERKRVEREIQLLNQDLEQRVKDRTAELQVANSELHERSERLRAIMNTVADAIITTDQSGAIRVLNPAAEQMFGASESGLIAQRLSSILKSPSWRQVVRRTGLRRPSEARAQPVVGWEGEGIRGDGETFPVEVSVGVLSELRLITFAIRDVSVRKRMERDLLIISEREQRTIGMDLHDGLGPQIASIGIINDTLRRDLEDRGIPEAKVAAREGELLREASAILRGLCHGLLPVDIDPYGLMAALQRHVEIYRKRAASAARLEFICPTPVLVHDQSVATHLFRIAQEALNNALRHADARRIRVRLWKGDGQLHLEIRDNGKGIQMDQLAGGGLGLRTMRYRADAMGGTLTISSPRGGGTQVACSVPAPPAP